MRQLTRTIKPSHQTWAKLNQQGTEVVIEEAAAPELKILEVQE